MRQTCPALLVLLACCSAPRETDAAKQEGDRRSAAREHRSLEPPPEAYQHELDRQRARRRDRDEQPPCSRRRRDEGEWVSTSLPIDQCVRMLPRQRFRGIWYNRFEVSVFWPDRVSIPAEEPPFWLDVQESSLRNAEGERAYLLEFEGRRTMYEGAYGGCCDYRHAILVDRVISARQVPD